MGTENQTPGGDLGTALAALGIDTATLSGGAYADPNDRELIWDREDRWPSKPLPGDVRMMEQGGRKPTMPVVKRETEATKHLYAMPDEEVAELQRRLWAGGFYPPGTDPEEIALGDRDPYTDKAWLNAIDRAANFKNAGRDITIWEAIDMGANIRKEGGLGADGSGTGRQPLVVELANPEDLKFYAQRTAVSTLGRALRPDELNRFVSSFQQAQTSAQTQAYNQAGGAGGTVVGAPSPTVAAEQFARQAAPVEAGAHDAVKVFDVVSKVLGGRRSRG